MTYFIVASEAVKVWSAAVDRVCGERGGDGQGAGRGLGPLRSGHVAVIYTRILRRSYMREARWKFCGAGK